MYGVSNYRDLYRSFTQDYNGLWSYFFILLDAHLGGDFCAERCPLCRKTSLRKSCFSESATIILPPPLPPPNITRTLFTRLHTPCAEVPLRTILRLDVHNLFALEKKKRFQHSILLSSGKKFQYRRYLRYSNFTTETYSMLWHRYLC